MTEPLSGAIATHLVYPPIPDRRFDWHAYRDPEARHQGWGPTEDAAILDLLMEEWGDTEADDATPYECDCGRRYAIADSVLECRKAGHPLPVVHFVGFRRGEAYAAAVRVWGHPEFIHRGWDQRARREIADGDIVVFAGAADPERISERNYPDIVEREP